MDIQVRHDSTDISSHVISYNREHKICTGIGMLELDVDYTYGATFNPWDEINIYENGVHAGRYFVSSVSEGQPSATITVSAQDNSKRLSDYFIAESYLIDYPSYTKYWIDLFLTQAGIPHSFSSTGEGSLLSNNTSLGLVSAYENVMQLLQLSGWYITFDAGGHATIGKLSTGVGSGGSFNDRDIIEIKVDKNDRMYRNRVVVWGNGDPETSRWVFADVNQPTKWDYDANDKRTILISNSNIPTVSAAFMLANRALTEFARLNIEKFITVEGSRNVRVGNNVYIRNTVFSGKGLVTTLAVSMSKSGLVTSMALDERCPRLFAYFNPGGYVYVGTFGSGVWRKHILAYSGSTSSGVVQSGLATGVVESGWQNYSSGIMDLNVTDLHVNNGVLASVTSNGELYYSLEDETVFSGAAPGGQVWSGVMLSGLQITYSGSMIDSTVYTGLIGRACIIDRDTNFLRYAVDTRSGENLGDFLMETDAMSGLMTSMFYYAVPGGVPASGSSYPSGIEFSDDRSWVIDANPYDGSIVESYPVWVSGIAASGEYGNTKSGEYNFSVYDIENDGTHDYISALTMLSGTMPVTTANGYYESSLERTIGWVTGPRNYSYTYYSLSNSALYGNSIKTFMPYSGYSYPERQDVSFVDSVVSNDAYSLYDYTPSSSAYIAGFKQSGASSYYIDAHVLEINIDGSGNVDTVEHNKPMMVGQIYEYCLLATKRISSNTFRYYYASPVMGVWSSFANPSTLFVKDYNIDTSSFTKEEEYTDAIDITSTIADASTGGQVRGVATYLVLDGKLISGRALAEGTRGFKIEIVQVDLDTGANSHTTVLTVPGDSITECHTPSVRVMPNGNGGFRTFCSYYKFIEVEPNIFIYELHRAIGDNFSALSTAKVLEFPYYPYFRYAPNLFQMTRTKSLFRVIARSFDGSDRYAGYADMHSSFYVIDQDSASPVDSMGFYNLDNSAYTIAYEDLGGFFKVDPSSLSIIGEIEDPPGYELLSYAGKDSFSDDVFFNASIPPDNLPSDYETIALNSLGAVTRRRYPVFNGIMRGNFTGTTWVVPGKIPGYFPMYTVLQRDGWDYHVVKSGFMPDRLDISNYSPLVTMSRAISSTETFFITSDNMVTETSHITISGYNLGVESTSGSMFTLGITGDDFRYSDFEDTTESGVSRKLLVVYSGAVGTMDLFEGGDFSGVMSTPSGSINRIEASNYSLPDQYIFVSVSGYDNVDGQWGFFQKSPSTASGMFSMSDGYIDCSSGYPQARTTIIRLDDKL